MNTNKKFIHLKNLLAKNRKILYLLIRFYGVFIGLKSIISRIKYYPEVFIDKSVRVIGWDNILFNGSASIGAFSFINVNERNARNKTLIFGKNVYLGRNNFISVGSRVEICDYVITANNCAIIGSNHKYENPAIPYLLSGTKNISNIRIGPNTFIGYGSTIVGNLSIGYGCVIGANSRIDFDVPPLSLVMGNPAKIIKRYDILNGIWISTLVVDCISEIEYLELLNKYDSEIILPFFAASTGFGDL